MTAVKKFNFLFSRKKSGYCSFIKLKLSVTGWSLSNLLLIQRKLIFVLTKINK